MAMDTPRDLATAFARCLSQGDIEGLLELYEQDGAQVRQDGSIVRGGDALRQVLTDFIEMGARLEVEVTDVVTLDDDTALLVDRWSLAMASPEGEPTEMSGRGVHLVRRQRTGTWLFAVTGLTNLLAGQG